jgi:hypothetical protein
MQNAIAKGFIEVETEEKVIGPGPNERPTSMPIAYSFGVLFNLQNENRSGVKPKIKLTAA